MVREKEAGLKAVFTATEEERQRIAKDLHDGIGQQLSGIKLSLGKQANTLGSEAKEALSPILHVVDQTAHDVRNLSHQMMPKSIQELGLVPAIDDMLHKSLGLSDLEYAFEHFNVESKRYDARLEIGLYRVCQELVNNIIKHSGAKAVTVQLFENKNSPILIVEDNGRGFDLDHQKSGIGLTNIQSRINTFDGEVNWEPSPGSGTVATVKVPITQG